MSGGAQLLSIETGCECDIYQSTTTAGSSPGSSSSASSSSSSGQSNKPRLIAQKELPKQKECQESYDGLNRWQLVAMLRDEKQKSIDQLAAFSLETINLRGQIQSLKQRLELLHKSITKSNGVQTVSKGTNTQTIKYPPSALNSKVSFSNIDLLSSWVGSPIKQQQQQQTLVSCSPSRSPKNLQTCPAEFTASPQLHVMTEQTKKLLGFLEDLVKQCSPVEMFPENTKPTERQIWKFVKGTTEEYVKLKKQTGQLEKDQANVIGITQPLLSIFKTSSIYKAVNLAKLQNEEIQILRKKLYIQSGSKINTIV